MSRALASVTQIFTATLYVVSMAFIATFILFWMAFNTFSSNVLSYILPESMHAAVVLAKPAAIVSSPFLYSFNTDGTLPEASSFDTSWSPYWWLSSGGYLKIRNGVGETQQGSLPLPDPWRLLYAASNPTDTDNGTHPQNIFRLVSRSMWKNARVETAFNIVRDNFSASPNRNASNGLLLMSRYVDSQTLYYFGIRVDGTAVIKKKYKGTYYTMAQKQIFPGTYSKSGNVNLIPHNEWISLRAETMQDQGGSITARLFMKRAGESSWTKLLETKDSGNFGGTPPITEAGYAGIRTDFMDVQFDSFRMEAL